MAICADYSGNLIHCRLTTANAGHAQDAQDANATLFENVKVFDGKSAALSGPLNVLVRGNIIEKISADPIAVDKSATTTIINGNGKTLMPGLIDAHAHVAMSTLPVALMMTADPNYMMVRNGKAAEELLMQGFTAVRDVGGPSFGLKRAIDEGFAVGPRIWPSGATIGQTSGHGDFRILRELPRSDSEPPHFTERHGYTAIADGVPEVLRRTREQLMQRRFAHQASGGRRRFFRL